MYLLGWIYFNFALTLWVSPYILGHSLYSKVTSFLGFQWKVWDIYKEIFTPFTWQHSDSKLCLPCSEQQLKSLLRFLTLQLFRSARSLEQSHACEIQGQTGFQGLPPQFPFTRLPSTIFSSGGNSKLCPLTLQAKII